MTIVYLKSKSDVNLEMHCEGCGLKLELVADRSAREVATNHIRDRHGSGTVRAFGFECVV